MRFKYLLIIGLLSSFSFCQSDPKIDSLKTVLQHKQPDSSRVRILESIYTYYVPRDKVLARKYLDSIYQLINSEAGNLAGYSAWYGNAYLYFMERKSDSAIYVLNKAMHYAEKLEDPVKIAEMHGKLALIYTVFNPDASKVIFHNDKVIELHKKHNLPFQVTHAYYTNGGLYRDKNEYPKALEYLIMVDSIQSTDKLVNNLKGHSALACGEIYSNLKQFDKAEIYFDKAISYYENLENINDASKAIVGKGKLFIKKGDILEAINLLKKAESYYDSTDNDYEKSELYMGLSDAFLENGETNKSYDYLLKAKTLQHKMKDSTRLSKFYLRLGGYYEAQKQLDSAKFAFTKTLQLTNSEFGSNDKREALKFLSEINSRLGLNKEALEQYKSYIALRDEISEKRNAELLAEIETKYQTVLKDKEIQELTFESQLKDANLAKARSTQIALAVGALAIIIILLVFFLAKHKKDKAEREAQALQVEALQKRFMELHTSPSELSVDLNMEELNSKLQTQLTEREFETLKLCIAGKTNSDIAKQLFVTVSTVKFHLRNAYSKLDVNNRKEAFQFILKSM